MRVVRSSRPFAAWTRMVPSAPLATNTRLPAIATCCGGAPDGELDHRSQAPHVVQRDALAGSGRDPQPGSVRGDDHIVRSVDRRERPHEAGACGICGIEHGDRGSLRAECGEQQLAVGGDREMAGERAGFDPCHDPGPREVDDRQLTASGIGHVRVPSARAGGGVARLAEALEHVLHAERREVEQRDGTRVRVAHERHAFSLPRSRCCWARAGSERGRRGFRSGGRAPPRLRRRLPWRARRAALVGSWTMRVRVGRRRGQCLRQARGTRGDACRSYAVGLLTGPYNGRVSSAPEASRA